MAMKPVVQLKVGDRVRPRFSINRGKVSHWLHARECADIGGGIEPSAELTIVETNATPGNAWVRLQIPGSDPPKFLKVSGGELSGNFDLVMGR